MCRQGSNLELEVLINRLEGARILTPDHSIVSHHHANYLEDNHHGMFLNYLLHVEYLGMCQRTETWSVKPKMTRTCKFLVLNRKCQFLKLQGSTGFDIFQKKIFPHNFFIARNLNLGFKNVARHCKKENAWKHFNVFYLPDKVKVFCFVFTTLLTTNWPFCHSCPQRLAS